MICTLKTGASFVSRKHVMLFLNIRPYYFPSRAQYGCINRALNMIKLHESHNLSSWQPRYVALLIKSQVGRYSVLLRYQKVNIGACLSHNWDLVPRPSPCIERSAMVKGKEGVP